MRAELHDVLERICEGREEAWSVLKAANGLLVRSLGQMVEHALACDSATPGQLQKCFETVASGKFLDGLWNILPEKPGIHVDKIRLQRNVSLLIAAAGAATAVKRGPADPRAAQDLAAWWHKAAAAILAEPDLKRTAAMEAWEGLNPADPVRSLDAFVDTLPKDWPAATLRLWTLRWLHVRPKPARLLRIPVLFAAGGKGYVADLELIRYPGKGELVEDPEMAVRELGSDLVNTMRKQYERRSLPSFVCWNLVVRAGQIGAESPLDGPSLGAAMAVGFELLKGKFLYDSDSVLTAAVDGGDPDPVDPLSDALGPVGDEEIKLHAAKENNFRRVGLAKDPNRPRGIVEAFRSSSLKVRELSNVGEAVDFASGIVAGLHDYLARIVAAPDLEPAPRYLENRKPSALYIDPDVLVFERRSKASEKTKTIDMLPQRSSGPRAAETRDFGEEQLEGKWYRDATERRTSWHAVQEQIGIGGERFVVLLGAPGQGKSQLVRFSSRKIATVSIDRIKRQDTGVESLDIPILIDIRKLVEAGTQGSHDPAKALRRAIRKTLASIQCPDAAASYIEAHVHEARIWLFMDALDELPPGKEADLGRVWEVLSTWQSRIIVTSRPYAWDYWRNNLPAGLRGVMEYHLAPFSCDQQSAFLASWQREETASLAQLVLHNPAIRQVAQNPLLLTLTCSVSKTRHLSEDITRTQLVEQVMLMLLEERAHELLPMLAEVVFHLFVETKGKKDFTSRRLRQLVAKSRLRPNPAGLAPEQVARLTPLQQADFLIKELEEKRLLIPCDDRRSAYVFPHRSLAEYLAGCDLANKMERGKCWRAFIAGQVWLPGWEQVAMFAVGELTKGGAVNEQRRLNAAQDLVANMIWGNGDLLGYRISLALDCLEEVPSTVLGRHFAQLIARALTEVQTINLKSYIRIRDWTPDVLAVYVRSIAGEPESKFSWENLASRLAMLHKQGSIR